MLFRSRVTRLFVGQFPQHARGPLASPTQSAGISVSRQIPDPSHYPFPSRIRVTIPHGSESLFFSDPRLLIPSHVPSLTTCTHHSEDTPNSSESISGTPTPRLCSAKRNTGTRTRWCGRVHVRECTVATLDGSDSRFPSRIRVTFLHGSVSHCARA